MNTEELMPESFFDPFDEELAGNSMSVDVTLQTIDVSDNHAPDLFNLPPVTLNVLPKNDLNDDTFTNPTFPGSDPFIEDDILYSDSEGEDQFINPDEQFKEDLTEFCLTFLPDYAKIVRYKSCKRQIISRISRKTSASFSVT